MKIDFKQLLINENAYFFRLRQILTSKKIESIFDESLNHKKAKRVFEPKLREPYVHGGKEIAKISYDIFQYKKRPSFLTKDVPDAFETKFGLFLIVETVDLVAIIRKNVSGVKLFYTYVEKINYATLVRFLLKPDSKFEKITSSSMNAASNSMHRKTSEATDLQGVLSRYGTSKQIISSIRVGNKENRSTVTVNTSRVNSFNVQNNFEVAVLWMVDMMKLIRQAAKVAPQNHFIDSFATPVEFDNIIDDINPTYLMIRLDALKDQIDNGEIERIYNAKTNKKVDFEAGVLSFERLFQLKLDKTGVYIDEKVKVKVLKDSIAITITPLRDIILDFGNNYEIDLNSYIKSQSYYMIVFDKPQYVYSHGMIFEDTRLLGDKENFMSTFVAYEQLANIDSEKGSNYLPKSTQFTPNSLFNFVEQQFASTATYLMCDDLGVEWGDYISISDNEVIFFHLKHNKAGLSPKNLENVFGQAQKNFGFLQLTEEMIEVRRKKWTGFYRTHNVVTSIHRTRKSPNKDISIDELIKYADLVSANPNIRRKVFVVVSFISKRELSKMFDKVKSGNTLQNQGVILQMLWLTHGILALATELGVEFRILCRP
jgi:hypothetical protein